MKKKSASTSNKVDSARMATAFHEAGHAVMALHVGRPVEKITIIAAQLQTGGNRLGACKVQKGRSKAARDALEDEVLILLSGMVAESHFTQAYCQAGASQDLRAVERLLANRASGERQLQKLAARMLRKTEHVLSESTLRTAIAKTAEALYESDTISGRAVRQLMDEARTID